MAPAIISRCHHSYICDKRLQNLWQFIQLKLCLGVMKAVIDPLLTGKTGRQCTVLKHSSGVQHTRPRAGDQGRSRPCQLWSNAQHNNRIPGILLGVSVTGLRAKAETLKGCYNIQQTQLHDKLANGATVVTFVSGLWSMLLLVTGYTARARAGGCAAVWDGPCSN